MDEGLTLEELENLPEPKSAPVAPISKGLTLEELDAKVPDVITDKVVSSPMSAIELEQFYKDNPDLQAEILKNAPSLPSVQNAEAYVEPTAADYINAFGKGALSGGQEMYSTLRKGLAHVAAPVVGAWNKTTGPEGYIGNERSYDSLVTDAYDRAINSEGVPGLIADPINLVSAGVGSIGERLALRALPSMSGAKNILLRAGMGAGEGAGYMAASNALDTNRTSNMSDVGYGALLGAVGGGFQGMFANEANRVSAVKASNLAKQAEYAKKIDQLEINLKNNENARYWRENGEVYKDFLAPKYTFEGKEYTDLTNLKKNIANREEYKKYNIDPESITDKEAIDFMEKVFNPDIVAIKEPKLNLEQTLPKARSLIGPLAGLGLGLHFGGDLVNGTIGAGVGLGVQQLSRPFIPLAERAYNAYSPNVLKTVDNVIGGTRYPIIRATRDSSTDQ